MPHVTSKDGTPIAYEVKGQGPALVLVDGALCYRASGPGRKIAELLAAHFTTYLYDRRGRGESGNTEPYAIEREIEDLEAVLDAAGGQAFVFGQSSGAVLSLEAARVLGPKVQKLALYEAPMIVDGTRTPMGADAHRKAQQLIAEGRRGDAVLHFFQSVQMPRVISAILRLTPMWPKLKAIAHTLPHDFALTVPYQGGTALPAERWANVTVPTWVADGGKSPAWMRNGQKALAQALPNAQHHTLPGQTHAVSPKSIAPQLTTFFRT